MGRLVCPFCGAFTSFSPVTLRGRGVLPEKSSKSYTAWEYAELLAVYDGDRPYYAILTCEACDKHFLAENQRVEWSAVHPIQHKPVAGEIPEPLRNEFEEAQLCFAVRAYRGCLLLCRTVLIALQREQNVSSLKGLKDKGSISDQLYRQANEVRLWANIVGHEDIAQDVTKDDSEQLLTYLEAILNAVYVEPVRLAALGQKREQMKKGSN